MATIYYDKDADLTALEGKTIAVIGYGNQGRAQALNMKDSGLNVIIGLREGGSSWNRAKEDGFDVFSVKDASEKADCIHILIPDEIQAKVYENEIKDGLKPGDSLSFSHGFNIVFGQIVPPDYVDVFMVAPKGPGTLVRDTYVDGFGVPVLLAVKQDATGETKAKGLAMAKALGATLAGVLETTFEEETYTDLFGEQVDLCGGVSELIIQSFRTLVDKGYQPEVAYFETLHELKLITDLIQKGGIEYMWKCVSNTAEYGGRTRGSKIIGKESIQAMKQILDDIESGTFAREFVAECDAGMPNLTKMREEGKKMDIEIVGERLRKMFRTKEGGNESNE